MGAFSNFIQGKNINRQRSFSGAGNNTGAGMATPPHIIASGGWNGFNNPSQPQQFGGNFSGNMFNGGGFNFHHILQTNSGS